MLSAACRISLVLKRQLLGCGHGMGAARKRTVPARTALPRCMPAAVALYRPTRSAGRCWRARASLDSCAARFLHIDPATQLPNLLQRIHLVYPRIAPCTAPFTLFSRDCNKRTNCLRHYARMDLSSAEFSMLLARFGCRLAASPGRTWRACSQNVKARRRGDEMSSLGTKTAKLCAPF